MANDFTVEIVGLEELIKRLGDVKVRKLALVRMRNASLIAEREAKRLAPVDTGRLRASITSAAREVGSSVEGAIGSNVEYAAYVEMGTRPHFVPQQYIGVWARRHGLGDTGLPVSGKAQPYLGPAVKNKMSAIVAELAKALDDYSKAVSG
jgi:HK97 gp10 family phage protein